MKVVADDPPDEIAEGAVHAVSPSDAPTERLIPPAARHAVQPAREIAHTQSSDVTLSRSVSAYRLRGHDFTTHRRCCSRNSLPVWDSGADHLRRPIRCGLLDLRP